jgi:hypothetical protein
MKLLTLLAGMALLSSCTPRAVAEPFATGLNQPRGMAFDDSGDLYIAVNGAFSAPGQGAILKLACGALGAPAACPRR